MTVIQEAEQVRAELGAAVQRHWVFFLCEGIALVLLSTVFLGTSDVTAKYLSSSMPSTEIAWIRFVVFALIMVPAMLQGSPLYALRTERLGLQLLRGSALLGSSLLFI